MYPLPICNRGVEREMDWLLKDGNQWDKPLVSGSETAPDNFCLATESRLI